jgi:hypothetical protein
VYIDRRRNDTQRKGHYPAPGRSRDPGSGARRRGAAARPAWRCVHPQCAMRSRLAAVCELYPPIFPLTRCTKGWAAQRWPRKGRAPGSRRATGSAGQRLLRRGATPPSSQGSRPARVASRPQSRLAWTIRSCTCRAGMVRRCRSGRICNSRRPHASSRRQRPSGAVIAASGTACCHLGRARAGGAVRRSEIIIIPIAEIFIIPIASCLQGMVLALSPARLPTASSVAHGH